MQQNMYLFNPVCLDFPIYLDVDLFHRGNA